MFPVHRERQIGKKYCVISTPHSMIIEQIRKNGSLHFMTVGCDAMNFRKL